MQEQFELEWCWLCDCAVMKCPDCGWWACAVDHGCDTCTDKNWGKIDPETEQIVLREAVNKFWDRGELIVMEPKRFNDDMLAFAKYDQIRKWERYINPIHDDIDLKIQNAKTVYNLLLLR